MLSCSLFISYSTVFSTNMNTRSITNSSIDLVSCQRCSCYTIIVMCSCILMREGMPTSTCTSKWDAATNATKNILFNEADEYESSAGISTARRDGSFTRNICFDCCRATPKRSIILCWVIYCDIHETTIHLFVVNIANILRIRLIWICYVRIIQR